MTTFDGSAHSFGTGTKVPRSVRKIIVHWSIQGSRTSEELQVISRHLTASDEWRNISILTATHHGSSAYDIWFRHTYLLAPSTKFFSFSINSTNHEASMLGFRLKCLANLVIWLRKSISRLREVFINLVFNPRLRCADWASWSSLGSRATHAPSGDHEGPTHGLQVSSFGINIANSNQILESSKPLSGLVNLLPSALAHGVISH